MKFRRVANRIDSRRLFDNDDVVVEMPDVQFLTMRDRNRRRFGEQRDRFAFFDPARWVEAEFAVDLYVPLFDRPAHVVP